MEVFKEVRRPATSVVGALWAVLLSTAMLTSSRAAHAAPLEVYGRLPTLEQMALSPDGTRLAFVRTVENKRMVAILELPNKLLMRSPLGETKLRDLSWADSDHLMITTSVTGIPWGLYGKDQEWEQLRVYELSTNKLRTYPESDDRS